MDEGNHSSLELGATASVDSGRREGLPDDRFADVGRNEKGDTASKTVALLKQLIEQDDNKTSNNQLHDQEHTDTSTEVAGLTIETRKDVDTSLAKGEDDGKQLLSGLVQLAVGLQVKVDIDEVGSSKELALKSARITHVVGSMGGLYLKDHAGGDDGSDTQLHQRSSITGQHHTEPVQRIRGVRRHDTVQRHLAHHQEDQQSQLHTQCQISKLFPVSMCGRERDVLPSTSTSG